MIAKKRNRERSSSKSTKNLITNNSLNNKIIPCIGKTNKKTLDQNNFINEMEIEEETKDNSNNNEAVNNYSKHHKNQNGNYYGNDFENIDRLNGINYKYIKNKEFSDDESHFYQRSIVNIEDKQAKKNKIENSMNKKPKDSNSPKKKRKKTSNDTLEFSLEKQHNNIISYNENEKNDDDSCPNCFLCGWKYPNEMDLKDKNEHINYCADGEGEKHKKMYGSSQRLIKIAIHSQEEENPSSKKDLKNKNAENAKEKGNNFCHICSKRIYLRNGKTIDEHILQCYKEKEDEIFKKTGKK